MFNLTTKPVSAGELMKKEKKPINFVVKLKIIFKKDKKRIYIVIVVCDIIL